MAWHGMTQHYIAWAFDASWCNMTHHRITPTDNQPKHYLYSSGANTTGLDTYKTPHESTS